MSTDLRPIQRPTTEPLRVKQKSVTFERFQTRLLLPLTAGPVLVTGCRRGGGLDCLFEALIGTPIAVFGVYPLLAKLVAPKASYGKRLVGSTAAAWVAGSIIIFMWNRQEAKEKAAYQESPEGQRQAAFRQALTKGSQRYRP